MSDDVLARMVDAMLDAGVAGTDHEHLLRAALRVLRDSAPELDAIGLDHIDVVPNSMEFGGMGVNEGSAAGAFQAMIDAVLNPSKPA